MTDQPRPGTEPVAVIGIGCRFPGAADSPDRFWDLLRSGRNTAADWPADRWRYYRELGPEQAALLRRTVARGSFLAGIDGFDAEFFGLSPREAELMDPQQRILLETAWEALEHAGVPARDLAGTDTGVFVGVCTDDYGRRLMEDLPGIEAWTGIGAATCAVANRISHALDLRGPSLAVDTACSASLVALHLAAQSLRTGESALALAGGVNLLITPGETVTLDAAGALAPDGRSKSFDAAADGYGRGEGCGVLVLKRLADARRDGDRVLALVVGSAVNQDGHTNGIMAPCGTAQEYVMARACRQAGIGPDTVDYIEAHGTGTRLGDPLEAAALGAVYGEGRPADRPCLIGSVKANIGHLEGAAGIAGAIKAVLALHRGEIPPTPLATPNPDIPWQATGLRVVTEPTRWPAADPSAPTHPRRAGVSGFGYGGTVAHVVLEQAPAADRSATASVTWPGDGTGERLFPLSAGSEPALREYAGVLADRLASGTDPVPLASVGHTLAHRRSWLAHRAVLAAGSRQDLVDRLRQLAAGTPAGGVDTGVALPEPGAGVVWVFAGHGCQWDGMGRELLATEPAFAAVLDGLAPVFAAELGYTPREVLAAGELTGVDRVQSMIFAVQLGLAELWRAAGVRPAAVIGHSVGEIAAAVVAGALTREDGARLICRRSRLLRRVAGRGAMAMAGLPFAEVAGRLAGRTDVVAAISAAPASTVLSGDPDAVRALVADWSGQGVAIRPVASDVAFHGPQMDPLLPELVEAAADLAPARVPQVAFYPTALDDPRAVPSFDGGYWAANLRNPVRLAAAVTAAARDGYRAFLEISPHPVVAHSVTETLAAAGCTDVYVGVSLRRDRPARSTLLAGVGVAHCHGIAVDWHRLQPDGELVTLPATAWQRRRHWREPAWRVPAGGPGHDVDSHTLLGAGGSVAGSRLRVWRTALDDGCRPYPGSHTINGVEIVPAAVLVNTFLRAGAGGGTAGGLPTLTEVSMRQPLLTADRRDVQVVRDGPAVLLAARTPAAAGEPEPDWLFHVTGTVGSQPPRLPDLLADAVVDGLAPADPGLVGHRLAAVGVPGTGFEWTITELLYGDGVLRARVRTGQPAGAPATWAPALDAAMTVAPCAFLGDPVLRMVTHIDEVATRGEPPETVLIQAVLDQHRDDTVQVLVSDVDGRVVARLAGLRYPVIDRPAAGPPAPAGAPAAELADLPPARLRELVVSEVSAQIAVEMKLPPAELAPRRPLVEQGMDSVMTVVVRRRLEKRFGHQLPATLLWQQPTISAIADHLVDLLSVPSGGETRKVPVGNG